LRAACGCANYIGMGRLSKVRTKPNQNEKPNQNKTETKANEMIYHSFSC
jgi:hypothetical protein